MDEKPQMHLAEDEDGNTYVKINHPELGDYRLYFQDTAHLLFTENETNTERLYGIPNATPFVKDAFHTAVVEQNLTG